ncbi:MAG TPA: hypothetical protein VL131_09235 [Gammaproteobacteria bacterium]|nr:hypothetical protein [Gammaproteobacteria bacterium]
MDLRPLVNPTLLTVAAIYGVMLWFAVVGMREFFSGQNPFALSGLVFWIVLLLSLTRYGYAVLRAVARGAQNLQPPGPETANPVDQISLSVHLFLCAGLTYVCATTPLLGDGVLAAFVHSFGLATVLALFPASAALMGITGNIAAAVNPFSIAHVIAVLRLRYLWLLGMCVVLLSSTGVAAALLDRAGVLAGALAGVVATWAYLALFALIGAEIFAQRRDFDLPGEIETRELRDVEDLHRNWHQVLDRAYASIRSGFVEQGYRAMRDLIASEGESLDVYQWVFNRLLDWHQTKFALDVAQKFLSRLVAERRYRGALDLIEQCRRLSPEFKIPPEVAKPLSDYARTTGRPRLADELSALAPR